MSQITGGVQAALAILNTSKALFGQAAEAGIPVPMDARVKSLEEASQLLAEHVATIKEDDKADDQRVALLVQAVESLEKDVVTSLGILRDSLQAVSDRLLALEKAAAKKAAPRKTAAKAS